MLSFQRILRYGIASLPRQSEHPPPLTVLNQHIKIYWLINEIISFIFSLQNKDSKSSSFV